MDSAQEYDDLEEQEDPQSTIAPEEHESASTGISLPEGIFMVLLTLCADTFGLFAALTFVIPFLGQAIIFVSALSTLFVWIVIQFWLIMRGVPGWWYGGGSIVDIISGGAVPLQTPLLVVNLLINNSKLGAVAGALKGKGARSLL